MIDHWNESKCCGVALPAPSDEEQAEIDSNQMHSANFGIYECPQCHKECEAVIEWAV